MQLNLGKASVTSFQFSLFQSGEIESRRRVQAQPPKLCNLRYVDGLADVHLRRELSGRSQAAILTGYLGTSVHEFSLRKQAVVVLRSVIWFRHPCSRFKYYSRVLSEIRNCPSPE